MNAVLLLIKPTKPFRVGALDRTCRQMSLYDRISRHFSDLDCQAFLGIRDCDGAMKALQQIEETPTPETPVYPRELKGPF
jgi:hypothetical protein